MIIKQADLTSPGKLLEMLNLEPPSQTFNGNLNFNKIPQVIQRHSKTQEALLLVHNSHHMDEETVYHKWCNLSEIL